jgi:hypothetical protein
MDAMSDLTKVTFMKIPSSQRATRRNLSPRSNCAFAATIIVERLIAIAPTLMGRSIPRGTKRPPAYPTIQGNCETGGVP